MNRKQIRDAGAEVLLAFGIVLALAGAVTVVVNWDDFLDHCAAKMEGRPE